MKILKYQAEFENQTIIECSTLFDKNAYDRAFYKIKKIAENEGAIVHIAFEEVDVDG